MDEEQLWFGAFIAALAGGARSAAGAALIAEDALKLHLKRWPDGYTAGRKADRAEYERECAARLDDGK